MLFEELRVLRLLDGLSDREVAALVEAGEEVPFAVSDRLFEEGRPAEFWFLLLDGEVSLIRRIGDGETVLGSLASPGQWAGGFRAWDEHGSYLATGCGARPGRVLRVPSARLGALAGEWFPFGVHLMKGLVQTARRIESNARQREALVALGTLAAGLAHEINNPAAAAVRAVGALDESCGSVLTSLRMLAAELSTSEQFLALDELRRNVPGGPVPVGMALVDREDELTDWLTGHGVDKEWALAPTLAAAGIDTAWCDRVAGVLDGEALQHGLEWVAASLTTIALLGEVQESTRRISDLVGAVKSYSQMDRAAVQEVDVTEGLESTLTMLGHELKEVTVEREYAGGVPAIEASPGELNQVWTNLISNAVDAMADMPGTGTLRVCTRAEPEWVVVEIADTGPGFSQESRAHAFEPFFTTKDVGKGTGLGLDISRRIVAEHHGGDIDIESEPGRTVIRVRLPRRRLPAR